MKENNNKPVKWHSNLSQIEKNFYFHSLIKYTNNTQHYIVEDIQNYMQQFGVENQVLYYLKQIFLTDQKEFDYQVRYYNDLFHYCSNLSIRRKDVCRLLKYFIHQDKENSQYEIVLIMEYGEADRIDVDQIENSHINKFLKNIISLLQDMKKYSEVHHGNLDIQNIILVQDILKISGFKPIFVDKENLGWKEQIINEYGRERLDLFLLGLLWLQFKKFSLSELTKDNNTQKLVYQNIKATFIDQMESLNGIEGKEILVKLLDLQNYPQFDLQQLQLIFDTNLLLKDIKTKDDENLNPFKQSLKSEYVNSSLQDEIANKRPMVINKDFSLKADIVANFKKHNKDELISIQDLNDSQAVEIYNEENQQKNKEKNERLSVSNKEQTKKYSSQYNSEKNFESYKEQIKKIKEEAQQKNQMKNPIQQQPVVMNEDSKEQLQENNDANQEESYKESLVNFSLDQQSVQKNRDQLSKNNSSGVFVLNSVDSRQNGLLESKQQKNESEKQNDKPQKRDSKSILMGYLDSDKKGSIRNNEEVTPLENGTIEEKDESKFESVKPSFVEEDHLNFNAKFEKQTVQVKGVNEEDVLDQNEHEVEEDNQDKGQRFFELVQKVQQKQQEEKQTEQNEQQQQDQQQEDQTSKKQSKKQNKMNTYKDKFLKNISQKKNEHKKKEAKNYTNTLSKASNNKNSYKNLYSFQKIQTKAQDKQNLDTKIQKVLKKHQAQMLKNKRILTKDEKLDKSLEQVKRQKHGKYNTQSKSKSKEQKPNQKIKNLLKQSKISNINENEEFKVQTKVFEDINKKLFQSVPQEKQQQKTEMPITKRREVQNDYKSVRPMKQKKIQSLQADHNPLVAGLPDIKQKDKLDKSSFDIKFDISLNKSRNYDSYIDCKYKQNNYRSRSKNLPTDNILQDVYQKQNTFGNETLNFSMDNSFANTYQDHNKTIENIIDKFDDQKGNVSQISQSKKPKKKAQFDLGEVQKLLNSAMTKQPPTSQQKAQKQSPNQSMNRSINRSTNKSLNKSLNKSVNRTKNNSYIKNKETLQQKMKNDPEILELQFGKSYQQKMKTLSVLLKHKKLEEAIELLFYVLQTEIGQQKIDAYKQLGILFCYTNDLEKAVEYTIRGIEYQDNQNLNENYVENKKALLMNLAITYSKRKEYDNCLDILMDDLFQNESNQPIAYMTILGDCHYSMKSFLNAFECYKEQIERLCQLLLNKDVYHNFILVTKKAVASLIEGQEFNFFPDFVKFVVKCGKRFSIAQETYEGQAKFSKLQDKLICAMIHVIWGKKDIQFMQHLMKYQKEKKLINLKNLSAKEINILVDDILSYTLDLKKSDQFKKFRNDFYLANEQILKAINSVQNQKPLQRQKVIALFNQGIFLIQEKNFQLAKIHHQECLDILQDKDIKNEQQIYVILYNIGLSMYKMNDEENCIYYLEQIYQRNCNNKQILSQALYLLVLSYYKTSQYEKIIQYFDSPLNAQYEVDSDLEFEHLQVILFLYFFANFRVRSGSLKKKLLDFQDKLKQQQDELLYHIVLANSKLMLKYFREKNLKVNIPMQEQLSKILLKDQKNLSVLMKIAKDFYFQQVEKVPIGQCIAQYGVKAQANFISCFILQMINLLNFSCSREYSLDERRKVIQFLTELTKNEEFTNKIFSQSLGYGQNKESKHDLTFINQEISKLDTTQNLGTTLKLNQTEKPKQIKKQQPKKSAKKQNKNQNLPQKIASSEKVFDRLKTDQDFEKLWLCSSKEKLDSLKDTILENGLKNYNHADKQRALLKLIFLNKQKQNEKQIVAGIKNLKFHKMQFKDFLEIVQALLLSQDNNNLKAFLTRVYREKKECFQEIIKVINEKFLENFDQILSNIKIQNFNEKQFYIENSVFYHLLSEDFKPHKSFLILTEELSILIVNFYKCLKLKSFNFVKEEIELDTIEKYKMFNIIYQYFVKDKRQEQTKHIQKTLNLACNTESKNFETNMYVLYLLINYCHSENLSEVQIIEKLRQFFQEEDMNQQQLYMFVLITSLISNTYFRKQQWMKSNKLKQLSFEGFKKLDIQNLENLEVQDYPVYSKEYLLFQIFSFWYMNEHNLGSRDLAKRCLSSLEKFNFQDENLKNQFLILKQYDKKFTEAGLENFEAINLEQNGIVNEILNNVQMLLAE